MSVTIFCTFEQQDLADLAVGKLRNSALGIKSIHYVGGHSHNNAYSNSKRGDTGINLWGGAFSQNTSANVPSRPVTVKIVCSATGAATVKSRLINMHAYQIITTG